MPQFKKLIQKGPGGEFEKIWYVLKTILLIYLIVWVGTLIRNNIQKYQRIGLADRGASTVTVEGSGTVRAAPNIANIQVGLISQGREVAAVQAANAKKMNALISEFRRMGIEDRDLQTANFSINPTYDYRDGRSNLSGYEVTQSVTVKVRDLSKLGAVFAQAGMSGANQVFGPTFTLDDEETLKSQARSEAIELARKKLAALSRDLGVRPVRLVAFSETSSRPPPVAPFERLAVGGAENAPPEVKPGEVEISVEVSVTYEVQ